VPKVAIVHDWLVTCGGAERVLGALLQCFPGAELYCVIDKLPEEHRAFLGRRSVHTSFLQGFPRSGMHYRAFLPLMPLAVEQFDLSGYDLVISSSHAVAKGVLTGPDQLHVCLCHSPIRYAWDLQHQYLHEAGLQKGLKGWMARLVLHYVRLWDVRTANGVDHFVAVSRYIARRIRKVYRRDSTVIHPPVDVDGFSLLADKEDFYVTASRMVPYKRMDLIVEAFSAMPDRRLVVIGHGPDFEKIRAKAGPNVQLLGFAGVDVLRDHLQRARAFIFAAEEDFGITPVEAQACGTPVIAYGRGGALETVIPLSDAGNRNGSAAPTGIFFQEQSAEAIVAAVERFERVGSAITPEACRENALRFSPERFRAEFSALIEREWAVFQRDRVSHGLR